MPLWVGEVGNQPPFSCVMTYRYNTEAVDEKWRGAVNLLKWGEHATERHFLSKIVRDNLGVHAS